MILTVTLNPAVDKTYTTEELFPGHVNRMKTMTNIPGGKGINVSKILCQYNCPVTATGFLGGYTGRWIHSELTRKGIDCQFVEVAGETRSSMNIIAENGYVTEILEPGPRIEPEEKMVFLQKYRSLAEKSELIVLSGSIAPGLPTDIYRELIFIAGEYDKKVLLDTSGEMLDEGISAGPYLVKPNRKELEYLAGHRLKTREELIKAAENLLLKGITYVAVSVGEKGLYLISREKKLFAPAPKIHVMNTVGCGDSAVASFARSIQLGRTPEEMLRKAAAVAASNAVTMESGSVAMELVEELEEKIVIEEIEDY